jgi:hypothetical protein
MSKLDGQPNVQTEKDVLSGFQEFAEFADSPSMESQQVDEKKLMRKV